MTARATSFVTHALGFGVLGIVLAFALAAPAAAQEEVHFPSLDGTKLRALLYRPQAVEGEQAQTPRMPALVLLHGCSGMQSRRGELFPIYREWAAALRVRGYAVLLVDSARSRGLGHTCTASEDRRKQRSARPRDAFAALLYLQAQEFVQPDRIGVIGWSQGGGVVLRSIREPSPARPDLPQGDFRAAVAFYPGACNQKFFPRTLWTSTVPLLVLQGGADNWTPAEPCAAFIADAKARGAPASIHVYPDAHHGFDGPTTRQRELRHYRMENGVAPIVGTDVAARADAFARTFKFFERFLVPAQH